MITAIFNDIHHILIFVVTIKLKGVSDVNLVARTLAGNVEYILKAKYSITGERTQCEPAVLSSSVNQQCYPAV